MASPQDIDSFLDSDQPWKGNMSNQNNDIDSFLDSDKPWQQPKEQGPGNTFTALGGGAMLSLGAMRNAFNVYTGDNADILEQSISSNNIRRTDAQTAFMDEIQRRTGDADVGFIDSVKNVTASAWNNPRGAYHEMVAQLPNSAAVMGSMTAGAKIGSVLGSAAAPGPGTVIGGIAGGIIGLFGSTTALETGFLAQDAASDGEVTDQEISDVRRQGAIKGAVITGIDAATMGLSRVIAGVPGRAVERAVTKSLSDAGVDVASETAIRAAMKSPEIAATVAEAGTLALSQTMSRAQRLGRNGVAFGLETTSEGAGEYLGSTAAGLEASPTDAVMESLLSMPQSAAEMALVRQTITPGRNTAIAREEGANINQTRRIFDAPDVDSAINEFEDAVSQPDPGSSADPAASQPQPTSPIDQVIARAERAGDTISAVRLQAAKRLEERAVENERMGDTERAQEYRARAAAIMDSVSAKYPPAAQEAAPEADTGAPAEYWTGRRGDGYVTVDAAETALKTRERIKPELNWKIERMPSGKYHLAGYYPTITPAAYEPPQDVITPIDYKPLRQVMNPEEQQAFDQLETDRQNQMEQDYQAALQQRADQTTDAAAAETAKQEVMSRYSRESAPANPAMGDALLGAFVRTGPEAPAEQEAIADDDGNTWENFEPGTGTLQIPRSEMPQIKSEHRGAMVNFLKGRGIASEKETVPAMSLKPTQREFSPEKVQGARDYKGGNRSILVSSDNHVIDGHHQWLAGIDGDIDIIRIDAPVADILETVKEFPSAQQSTGAADPVMAELEDIRAQYNDAYDRGRLTESMDSVTRANDVIVEFAKKSFEQGVAPFFRSSSGGMYYSVTPSTRQPGKFQVTTYNDTGALGDTVITSLDDLRTEVSGLYTDPVPPAEAEEIMTRLGAAEADYQQRRAAYEQAQAQRSTEAPAPSQEAAAPTSKADTEQATGDAPELSPELEAEIQRARQTRAAQDRRAQRRVVNTETDTMVRAAIKLGGIKPEWREDIIGDTRGNKSLPGVGSLFSPSGTSIDDMAAKLAEAGYIPESQMQNLGGVPWMTERLGNELAGREPTYSLTSSKALDNAMADREQTMQAQQEMLEAEREAGYAEIEREFGKEAADLSRQYDDMLETLIDSELIPEAENYEREISQREANRGDDGSEPLTLAQATARDQQIRKADDQQGEEPARAESGAQASTGGSRPELNLTSQTEAERQQAQTEAEQRQQEADRKKAADREKADADAQRDDFRLSGSAAPSDTAASYGQGDMLTQTRGQQQPAPATVTVTEDWSDSLTETRRLARQLIDAGFLTQADADAVWDQLNLLAGRTLSALQVYRQSESASKKSSSTAPEHSSSDPDLEGLSPEEMKEMVKAFERAGPVDHSPEVTNIFKPVDKKDVVRLANKVKVYQEQYGWMTLKEAKARVAEWKKNAEQQYDNQDTRSENSRKVVLSFFDLSGEWSRPWEEAGYQVYRFDIQDNPDMGDVNNFSAEFFGDWFGDFGGDDVYAILAACPCTDFAVSGARHFAAKDADGRTIKSVRLVKQTLAAIEYFKPPVWALENPVGRIEKLTGLPPWRLSFDPNHLGEPYTKKTLIWGRFNADLPIAPVEPTEGSKMHSKYGGSSVKTKNARSVTPEGFSYGFFQANNAVDNPVLAVHGKYDRLDRQAIAEALDAGITPTEIDNLVEDFYYQDLNDEAANEALREATTAARDNEQTKAADELADQTEAAQLDLTAPPSEAPEAFGDDTLDLRRPQDKMASINKDLTEEQIASLPLSKIWPKAEVDAIEDTAFAAFATAARGEIPNKPRKAYALKRWAQNVSLMRGFVRLYMDSPQKVIDRLRSSEQLSGFMNKVDLLSTLDREQWSRIGSVNAYPGSYKYGENGEKIPSPMVAVNIDGRHNSFSGGTIAEVADQVAEKLGKTKDAPKKKMKFTVRGVPGKYFIHKDGDPEYRRLKLFTSTEDAFAYQRDNHDDLVAAWEAVKERDNVRKTDTRRSENRPRTGDDYRNGRDVTSEEFHAKFGLRHVDWGNWVAKSGERQAMLNEAYDAFMDLSNIAGIPSEAIGLDGSLIITFGKRGSGWAAAHFEPGNTLINMTRTKGAGSLAHEWFHALDNYFQKQRGGAPAINREGTFITYKPEPMMVHKTAPVAPMTKAKLDLQHERHPNAGVFKPENWKQDPNHPDGVRPQIESAFASLVDSLERSPMSERSARIDQGKSDGYWSRIIERAARSFESYVIAKMQKAGYQNDYLANIVSIDEFSRDPDRYPYLLESEMEPVEAAFDNLFDNIDTRQTNTGVAIYEPGETYAASEESAEAGSVESDGDRPDQFDLFAAPTQEKRQAYADLYGTIVVPRTVQKLKSATDTIKTEADLAHLLASIRKNPQETFYAVATDDKGKILRVMRYTRGTKNSSAVYPTDVVAEAASIEGAKNLHFAHNHPSGGAGESQADIAITDKIQALLDGTGISAGYHVIVAGQKYGSVPSRFGMSGTGGGTIKPRLRNKSVSVTERRYTKTGTLGIRVTNSENAFEATANMPDSVVLLSNQRYPVAVVRMSPEEMRKLRDGGRVNRILSAINKSNAAAAIIRTNDRDAAMNVAGLISRHSDGVQLLDWINDAGESAVGSGEILMRNSFFSRGEASPVQIPADTVRQIVSDIQAKLPNSPEIIVVQNMSDPAVPEELRAMDAQQHEGGATGTPGGFYHRGKAYVVVDGLARSGSETEAEAVFTVIAHEVLGHAGLRGLFRSGLADILAEVAEQRAGDIEAKAREYGLDINKPTDRLIAAEEMLAEMAQTQPENSLVTKAVEFIRRALRRLFMSLPASTRSALGGGRFASWINALTDAEIIDRFIVPARDFIMENATQEGDSVPSFMRAGADSGWYRSALRENIGQIRQMANKQGTIGKAQAKQWIQSATKKGLFKAEEVEWTGLNDFIDTADERISVEAIQEFVNANGVQVEEVVLSDNTGDLTDAFEKEGYTLYTDEEPFTYLDPESEPVSYADLPESLRSAIDEAGGSAVYGEHQLPGGSNYREILLTLPRGQGANPDLAKVASWYESDIRARGIDEDDFAWDGLSDRQIEQQISRYQREMGQTGPRTGRESYLSSHWDQVNVLAHLRVSDRTDRDGNKVLFVEEIQSDWAQDGRRKGFRESYNSTMPVISGRNMTVAEFFEERSMPAGARQMWLENKNAINQDLFADPVTLDTSVSVIYEDGIPVIVREGGNAKSLADSHRERYKSMLEKSRAEFNRAQSGKVEGAPFVGNTKAWTSLSLKRLLAMAANGGYSKVAFITGEQSVDRYDLSKKVQSVDWTGRGNDTEKVVTITPVDGNDIEFKLDPDGSVRGIGGRIMGNQFDGKTLDQIIGKELADRVLSDPYGSMRGDGLRVGGEGMKSFYDSIVPSTLKDIGRKLGGIRYEEIDLSNEDSASKYIIDAEDIGADKNARQEVIIRDERTLDGVATFRNIADAEKWLEENDVEIGVGIQPGIAISDTMRSEIGKGLPLFSRSGPSQTDSPAFKAWFGDSKVVDSAGRPLEVYHGAPDARFVDQDGIFKNLNERYGEKGGDRAFWFAASRQTASTYADDRRAFDYQNADPAVIPAYLSMQNPLVVDGNGQSWREAQARGKTSDVIEQAREAGNDGVIIKNVRDDYGSISQGAGRRAETTDTFVVFSSNQIKSSTRNSGAFDADNPDIRFMRRPPLNDAAASSEWAQENRRLREEDKTLWDKTTKMLRKQFSPGGLLPDSIFKEKIARDGKLGAVELRIQGLVANLESAVRKEYGTSMRDLNPADQQSLNAALAGRMPENMKPGTKTAIVAMRRYLDRLSEQYATMLSNQVADMTRDFDEAEGVLYDAYMAAGRMDSAAEREELMAAAREEAFQIWGDGKRMRGALSKIADVATRASLLETILSNQGKYVHRSYQVFDDPNWFKKVDPEVVDAAREYLISRYREQNEDATSAEAMERAEVILSDILKNDTAYDSMESFIKESKLGAKDLSILKRRKDIAPEIRALMGEYADPRINFTKSATKMGRLIFNQKFLDTIREQGMGVIFFTEENRPPGTQEIAAEGSEVYAPLNGLYTYKEVAQAMQDALGREQMPTWYRIVLQANGLIKGGKTILSPTTSARNFQSAMFFSLANGHFDLTQARKSMSLIGKFTNEQKMAYVLKMKELGVIYDSPYAEEMMDLLRESGADNFFANNKTANAIRASWDFARDIYSFGDDFWKVIGFENEKASLLKHTDMTLEQAEAAAAERIRNTYPTYSMVGNAVQWLRRFPLVGTFVSFPAEIIRTSFNMAKMVRSDWNTPGMRPIAAKRALGMTMVAGFAYAAQELAKAAFDIDDEDEEAIRIQAAPWQKNSNIVVTGRDEDGQLRYVDISFLDPYNYFKRPINAMLRDQPFGEALTSAAVDMLSPFLGTDIAAGALMEVYSNKTVTGGEVYKESDTIDQKLLDIADHLRKAAQPGIASNLERTWKAMREERSAGGKQYNLYDEGLGWIGWRVSTLDPKAALYYRSFEFGDAKSDATRTLSEVLNDPNSVSDGRIASAYERSMRMRAKAYEDMVIMVNSAQRSGLDRSEVIRVLRASGVSQTDIRALLAGEMPPWRPTRQAEMGAVRRAEALIGREKAGEIMERYRRARRIEQD